MFIDYKMPIHDIASKYLSLMRELKKSSVLDNVISYIVKVSYFSFSNQFVIWSRTICLNDQWQMTQK